MRFAFALSLGLVFVGTAHAAKGTRFWNLTDNTITKLELAPAGTDKWGPDQAKNDKDGAVDHDERLKIMNVSTGRYDVRFTDAKSRTCLLKDIAVTDGDVFSIDEKQMAACVK